MKRIFIILAIAIITFFAQSAFANNIRFIQITDAHMSLGSEYSQRVLKSAVKDINSQNEIAFVVFTGDNIDEAKAENLRQFVEIVSKLKIPYYVTVGNHDVFKSNDLSKVKYYEILREKHFFYPQRNQNYKFKKNGFVFLIVDGAKEIIPGPSGYYKEDTLKWINNMLSKNSRRPVVIFQHFPLEYPSEYSVKSHKTYKAEEYQKILQKHNNVLAIVSGHLHMNGETMKDGIYHISTPSLLTLPNSYKIIDIVTTKGFSPIIYTQLKEFTVEK